MALIGHIRQSSPSREEPCAPNSDALDPAPIPSGWILSGSPRARGRILSRSTDQMAFTALWDCSAGRFNWYYGIDETICVMEGAVIVQDGAGRQHRLKAGDTFFFPAGSCFQWTVPSYVRKVAFLHIPLSRKMRYAQRIYHVLKRLVHGRRDSDEGGSNLLHA